MARHAEHLKEGNEHEKHHQIEHASADPKFGVDIRGRVAAHDQSKQFVIQLCSNQTSTDYPRHQMGHEPAEHEDDKRQDDMSKGGEVLLPPFPPSC